MDEPCEAPEPSALNALKAILAGVDGEDTPSCEKRRTALVAIRKSFESASCPRAWCEEALAADAMSGVVSALISSKNKEVSITPRHVRMQHGCIECIPHALQCKCLGGVSSFRSAEARAVSACFVRSQVKDEAAAFMALACGHSSNEAAESLWSGLAQRHGDEYLRELMKTLLTLLGETGPEASAVRRGYVISAIIGAANQTCFEKNQTWLDLDIDNDVKHLAAWIARNGRDREVPDATYLAAWDALTALIVDDDDQRLERNECLRCNYPYGNEPIVDLMPLLRIALESESPSGGNDGLASKAFGLLASYSSIDAAQKEFVDRVVELLRGRTHVRQALGILLGLVTDDVENEYHSSNEVDTARTVIVDAGALPILVSLLNPFTTNEIREETEQGTAWKVTSTLTGAAAIILYRLVEFNILNSTTIQTALESVSDDLCERVTGLLDGIEATKQINTCAAFLTLMEQAAYSSPSTAQKFRHKGALMRTSGLMKIPKRYSGRYEDVVSLAATAFCSLVKEPEGRKDALADCVLQALVGHLKDAKELQAKANAIYATYGREQLPYRCPPWHEASKLEGQARGMREGTFTCLDSLLTIDGPSLPPVNRTEEKHNARIVVTAGVLPLLVDHLSQHGLDTIGWAVLGKLIDELPRDCFPPVQGAARAVMRGLHNIPELMNDYHGRVGCWNDSKIKWTGCCLSVALKSWVKESVVELGLVPALVSAITAAVSSLPPTIDSTVLQTTTAGHVLKLLLAAALEHRATGPSAAHQSINLSAELARQLIRGGTAALLLSWQATLANGSAATFISNVLAPEVVKAGKNPGSLLSTTGPEHVDETMFGLVAAAAALHFINTRDGAAIAIFLRLLRNPGYSASAARALLRSDKQGEIARLVFSKAWKAAHGAAERRDQERTKRQRPSEPGGDTALNGSAKRHCCARREEFNVESFDTLKLVVAGQPFYGHGIVLRAASETLRVALQDLTREEACGPISLGDGPAGVPEERLHALFCAACEHAYFGTVQGLGLEGPVPVGELQEVARWLQMPVLLEECNSFIASALRKAETAEDAAPLLERLYEDLISEGPLPPVYIDGAGNGLGGGAESSFFVSGGPMARAFVEGLLRWGDDQRVARILSEGMGGALDKPRRARCVELLSKALRSHGYILFMP